MKRSAMPMRRTPMKRAAPPAKPPRERSPLVLAARPADARKGVMARAHEVCAQPKTPDRVDHRIRQSARGEECLVRIPGVCCGGTEHTIWSHAPMGAAGKGKSIKALDLCGAYCCTACDAAIDGQAPLPAGYSRAMAMADWFTGHMRSLVRLRQKGLA